MGPVSRMRSMMTTAAILLILVVSSVFSAPGTKPAENRFASFCKQLAPTTCKNSCTGQPCNQYCNVRCGFFFFYRRLCSEVAPDKCEPPHAGDLEVAPPTLTT